MTEETGGFLNRWSRRKAASRVAPAVEPVPEPVPELPPMESLGVDSDYTVFLARGVPPKMQAQALAVAWASDPAIADFRGMAEYAWDFNAPGYGALAPGDDSTVWMRDIVRSGTRLLAGSVAEAMTPPPPLAPVDAVRHLPLPAIAVQPDPPLLPDATTLPEVTLETVPMAELAPVTRRRHGGAVPA